MNARQRYLETILFGTPDKVPFSPGGPRESTLRAWRQQGLPEGVNWSEYLYEVLGIERETTQPVVSLDVSFQMNPKFEEKVLEHKDGHYIVQDWMGNITEISDEFDYTYIRSAKDFVTRKWHDAPVHNRAEWEERMVWRFDSHDPARYPTDLIARAQALKDRDYPVGLVVGGPFWQMREWLGMENLCVLMMDDPDFVQDLADFWREFISATLQPVLDNVQLDYITVAEDMAYKVHPMISPALTRRYVLPSYAQWAQQAKASGCPVFSVDSDGDISLLLPLWIEAGVNLAVPIEVAAGNDIVAFRQRFGKQLAYRGGIDKRAIAAGGEVMRRELLRVAPPLLKEGGFIPACDHGVPPDISWPNFVEYSRLLAQLTGWL